MSKGQRGKIMKALFLLLTFLSLLLLLRVWNLTKDNQLKKNSLICSFCIIIMLYHLYDSVIMENYKNGIN
jgi:hypothetical protein